MLRPLAPPTHALHRQSTHTRDPPHTYTPSQTLRDGVVASSPLRRGVTQRDVGALAAFLATDAAAAITGQTLFVDAGHSAVMEGWAGWTPPGGAAAAAGVAGP